MKIIKRDSSGERGVAMVLALMVLTLLTIMAMGALFTATRGIEIAGSSRSNTEAFYVAQSGINRTIACLIRFYGIYGSQFDSLPDLGCPKGKLVGGAPQGNWPAGEPTDPCAGGSGSGGGGGGGGSGLTLSDWIDPDSDYYASVAKFDLGDTRTSDSGFSYVVRYRGGGSEVRLLSTAERDGKVETAIEYIFEIANASPCENAIFLSGQSTGHPITGNVEIHGGVHISCDSYDSDGDTTYDETWTAMDPGGTAGIYNNYDGGPRGFPTELEGKIDGIYQDEGCLKTLRGKVLVKDCNIDLTSPDVHIGCKADEDWNGCVEDVPMDAIIIDGGLGDLGTGEIDYGEASSTLLAQTFADEYEFGEGSYAEELGGDADMYEFPNLHDPEDMSQLALNGLGGKIAQMKDDTDALTHEADGTPIPDSPWCKIGLPESDGGVTSMDYPVGCRSDDAVECVIEYADGYLDVKKDTVIDLSGCTSGASVENITYKGKGTFYYGNNEVSLDGNVLVDETVPFPSAAAIAFMTAGDMIVGPGAQSNIMGLLYAQGTISTEKQLAIAGIIMSNNLVTNQVPQFYQVPDLAKQAPTAFGEVCTVNERLESGGWRLIY